MFVGTPLERAAEIAKYSSTRDEFDRRMRPILRQAFNLLGREEAKRLRREAHRIFAQAKGRT